MAQFGQVRCHSPGRQARRCPGRATNGSGNVPFGGGELIALDPVGRRGLKMPVSLFRGRSCLVVLQAR